MQMLYPYILYVSFFRLLIAQKSYSTIPGLTKNTVEYRFPGESIVHYYELYSSDSLNFQREMIYKKSRDVLAFRGPVLGNSALMHLHHPEEYEVNSNEEDLMCISLFHQVTSISAQSSDVITPEQPPETYQYTIGGRARFDFWYFNEDSHLNANGDNDWSKESFETMRMEQRNMGGCMCGPYRTPTCDTAIDAIAEEYISGKVGLVVGSLTPWAEVRLLNASAARVITIEYLSIQSGDDKVQVIHPKAAAEMYLSRSWTQVDFVFTFSSIEHDGLGRYGDPINPFSDLETVARLWCLVKPGGLLLLGLPVGKDAVRWNAARVYGKYRLSLITIGWEILSFVGGECHVDSFLSLNTFCQPVLILRKLSRNHFHERP